MHLAFLSGNNKTKDRPWWNIMHQCVAFTVRRTFLESFSVLPLKKNKCCLTPSVLFEKLLSTGLYTLGRAYSNLFQVDLGMHALSLV